MSKHLPSSNAVLSSPPAEKVVHLWTVDLLTIATDSSLTGCLVQEECDRAQRFRFLKHRRRFVAGRGAVRYVLARYIGGDPAAVRFRYGQFGKPEIDNHTSSPIHFNVTHTDDLLLLAVATVPVGVDLEAIGLPPEGDAIAREYFSPSEFERLRSMPSAEKDLGFARCWTRKEAFIKAIGEGMSHPLDTFEVAFEPHEPARLLRIGNSVAAAGRWTILEIETLPGYVAAIALEASEPRLLYLRFDDVLSSRALKVPS